MNLEQLIHIMFLQAGTHTTFPQVEVIFQEVVGYLEFFLTTI